MENIKKLDTEYVANTYARAPLLVERGSGAVWSDETGKTYIDLGSGIGVNCFGAADPVWKAAVTAQLDAVQHTSNLYYTEPCVKLAALLCQRTGMEKVFFSNSGAEANECAIKAARKYASDKYGDESHNTVITLKNSFHGRTITTLAATGQDGFHTSFGPFPGGFVYADPDVPGDLTRLADENACCAVMVEIIQGEGGVLPLSPAFLDELKTVLAAHDLLLLCDEVQTGNGRTGKLYAYMHTDLVPDVVSTAKGLGGGLPLGATLLGPRVSGVFTPGTHGSTFGGNPVCCAGALSIVQRLNDAFLEEVTEKSAYIRSQLEGAPGVLSVTGLGLMLGIEPVRPAKEILAECLEAGVVVLSAKQKVRLLPPLNIHMSELKKAIGILKAVLAKGV